MKKKAANNSQSFNLPAYLAEKRRMINDRLESLLDEYSTPSTLYHAMHYSLMNPGKRLRPILCVASAAAVGSSETERVMRTACAMEMIHTYSLIHDDLPAMDDDSLRRGYPTCHVRFNEATAILAGDALLTLAFEILAGPGLSNANEICQLKIISIIAKAAGNRGMIEGQMQDVSAQGRSIELKSLKTLHSLKTGAIIEASIAAGAIAGGGTETQVADLSAYARNIGLAFQVADDILNVEGDPEIMGKSTGTDNLHQKATYPALIGIDESKKYAAELIAKALQYLENFDNKAQPLFSIARYIIDRKR